MRSVTSTNHRMDLPIQKKKKIIRRPTDVQRFFPQDWIQNQTIAYTKVTLKKKKRSETKGPT